VDQSGQNCIILAPGANMRLTQADVDAAEEIIAGASVLLLQLESPLDVVEHAIRMAHAHSGVPGVTTVLNPAPARRLSPATLAQVDFLIPNESETALLTGIQVDNIETAK